MTEYLILTDKKDQFIGTMEKILVHKLGLLHRAFSVFIFNSRGEMLLQQRAYDKYHSGGLWSNACCSHPRFEENMMDAVNRRLQEEMGMRTDTRFAFSFIYKAAFENALIEHEYDHVYIGITDDKPIPDKTEVHNWKYINIQQLINDIRVNPADYTEWLKLCIPKLSSYLGKYYSEILYQNYQHVSR